MNSIGGLKFSQNPDSGVRKTLATHSSLSGHSFMHMCSLLASAIHAMVLVYYISGVSLTWNRSPATVFSEFGVTFFVSGTLTPRNAKPLIEACWASLILTGVWRCTVNYRTIIIAGAMFITCKARSHHRSAPRSLSQFPSELLGWHFRWWQRTMAPN